MILSLNLSYLYLYYRRIKFFFSKYKNYDDKLQDIRLENNKYIIELQKKFDSLIIDWEKVLELKKNFIINVILMLRNIKMKILTL